MTHRISNDEILRLIEQWEQLRPKLRHGPGEIPPDIPHKVRLIKRPPSESSAAALALTAGNPGVVESMIMVRFNPVTAELLKTIGTRLSVAVQEREFDTTGIDTVAIDPVAATAQNWAAADLTIGKLKIVAAQAEQSPQNSSEQQTETPRIPPGTYETYRTMLENPAIRQARARLVARIKAADFRLEIALGATAEMQRPAEKLIERLRKSFLNDAATMLDYGWVGFEVIYEIKDLFLEVEQTQVVIAGHHHDPA